jgi:hypothetical protein
MKRREFLKGIASVIAAAAAPTALVGQTFKWKATRRASGIVVVNPAWMAAQYEVMFLFDPAQLPNIVPAKPRQNVHPIVFQRLLGESIQDRVARLALDRSYKGCEMIRDSIPIRLDGDMKAIPPFKSFS